MKTQQPEVYVYYDFDLDSEFDYTATTDYLPTQVPVHLVADGSSPQEALDKLYDGMVDLGFIEDGTVVKIVDSTGELENQDDK